MCNKAGVLLVRCVIRQLCSKERGNKAHVQDLEVQQDRRIVRNVYIKAGVYNRQVCSSSKAHIQ